MKKLFAAAILGLLLATMPGATSAQEGEPEGDITLLGQTPFISGAAPSLELRLRVITETDDELFIRAATHNRARNRSAFTATIDDRPRTSQIDVAEVPLRDVVADEAGALVFPVPIVDATAPGVYPVRVELRSSEGVPIDGFTTHLIRLPATPDPKPMRVAAVLPLHAPPAVLPDGSNRLGEDSARSLADVVVAFARHSQPLNVLATPETIEAIDPNLVETITAALPGHTLLGRPFVALDPPALVTEGLQPVLADAVARGNASLESNLAASPNVQTWIADTPISTEAANQLRALGVTRFVVPQRALSELSLRTTLSAPFELDLRTDDNAPALAIDSGLSAHFERPSEEPVLSAHQLLADVALIATEAPGTERGVVVAPDEPWPAEPAFIEALLSGLSTSTGLFRSVGIDDLFEDVPALRSRRAPIERRLVEPDTAMGLDAGATQAARTRVASFGSLVGEDNLLRLELEGALLTSVALDNSLRVHRAYLAGVNDRIRGQLSLVQAPERRSITLTARRGDIPVTIRNGAPYPVRVRVRLDSDTLDFPDGDVRDLELEPGAHTERFTVAARSSGAFRLRVIIESLDGSLQVANTRLTVRSTVTSGVGLALSLGAGGFLMVWWASHLRGRRSRRLVPA